MNQPSPGLAFLLEQAGLALADAQQQIASLTAERRASTPALPDGAEGWRLPNRRTVYPTDRGTFAAADDGGWLDGERESVAAWLGD